MEVVFGYATLVALTGAIGVPVLVSLIVWFYYRWKIHVFLRAPATSALCYLPRHLNHMLFARQHYWFWPLQALGWAFPWVVVSLVFAVPAGILIDNGFVVGYGAVAGIVVPLVICFFLSDHVTERSHGLRRLPWWLKDEMIVLYFLCTALIGVVVENIWLT